MKLECSIFVKRQTLDSEFSHYDGSWSDLVALTEKNWSKKSAGYREGVVLVPVPPIDFYTNIIQLKSGDRLIGEYKSRQDGEEPRKNIGVMRRTESMPFYNPLSPPPTHKMPAEFVEIVCYRADEDGDRSTDADWEIVSVNASPFPLDVKVPMTPGTLMANHFHLSGGTQTNMTPEQFEAALRESVLFWKDKTTIT